MFIKKGLLSRIFKPIATVFNLRKAREMLEYRFLSIVSFLIIIMSKEKRLKCENRISLYSKTRLLTVSTVKIVSTNANHVHF